MDFQQSRGRNAGRNRTQRIIAETRKTVCAGQSFSSGSFNKGVLQWREQRPDIIYISRKTFCVIAGAERRCRLAEKGEEYKDETLSVRAFGSTDVGVSFLLQAGGKKIFATCKASSVLSKLDIQTMSGGERKQGLKNSTALSAQVHGIFSG